MSERKARSGMRVKGAGGDEVSISPGIAVTLIFAVFDVGNPTSQDHDAGVDSTAT